ncbi:MAG TPA: hypothetical protein EYO58_00540, partial [Flavobacteriales bacterium]|nr:hypothetical protein [Flavobacteriales bacterium]
MQLDLIEKQRSSEHDTKPLSKNIEHFRAIHYLGSKLRMLEFIKSIADKEDPMQGAIFDLFSGSGSVSQLFSNSRRVISVDIQEYSKVICTAVLMPCSDGRLIEYGEKVRSSPIRSILEEALQPLISYERKIVEAGNKNNLEPVCNFLENCSLYSAIENSSSDCLPELDGALTNTKKAIGKLELMPPLASIYFGGIYFSFEQAVHLDVILQEIKKAPENYKSTLMAAVLSTASDIVNTVGKQFAQPIRP